MGGFANDTGKMSVNTSNGSNPFDAMHAGLGTSLLQPFLPEQNADAAGSASTQKEGSLYGMSFSDMINSGNFWDVNPFAKFGTLFGEPSGTADAGGTSNLQRALKRY
jgi:hypothetical protein